MSLRRTVAEPCGLLPFLFENWPDQKRTRIKQCLKYGSVRVNGAPVTRHDHALRPGDTVTIQVEGGDARSAASPLPTGLKILHEDDSVIVLHKGPGWLSVARDNGKGRTVYAALTSHVRHEDPRLRVWIVHRLDRDTSGLMVFAKTEAAKHFLQEHWAECEKKYLAVVEGVVRRDSGTLRSHLDESNPMRVRSVAPNESSREAVTHFRVIRRSAERSLVELILETGRRHQIRVQLADMGHPVVGDVRYGAKTDPAKRLGLHSSGLTFPHPDTREVISFTLPVPGELAKLA